MLIGLSGVLTGYNGTFPFNKPGDKYGDTKYLGMRIFCATLGSLIVPFSYEIVWNLTQSIFATLLASILIIFGTFQVFIDFYLTLILIVNFFNRCWYFNPLPVHST